MEWLIISFSFALISGLSERLINLLSFKNNLDKGKFKKRTKWPILVVFILSSIASAYLSFSNISDSKSQEKDLKDSLKQISIKNDSLKKEIVKTKQGIISRVDLTKNQLVQDAAEKALKASIQLKNTSKEIQNNITGTDLPPIYKLANRLYKIDFIVTNSSSKIPAYFGYTIYDYLLLKKCKFRNKDIIDIDCANASIFSQGENITLRPNGGGNIEPAISKSIELGNIYKYIVYTEIRNQIYLEQVYIHASTSSINTLIRIFKFDKNNYKLYLEPYNNNEKIDWEKEFDLPKAFYMGKVN